MTDEFVQFKNFQTLGEQKHYEVKINTMDYR